MSYRRLRCLVPCALLILIPLSPQAYGSVSINSIEFDNPSLLDLRGNELESAQLGQQVQLSITAHNNEPFGTTYLMVTEVRDQDGITVYLALQNRYLNPLSDYKMASSWTPTEAGIHEVRVFALVSLGEPEILSPVYESRFTIK